MSNQKKEKKETSSTKREEDSPTGKSLFPKAPQLSSIEEQPPEPDFFNDSLRDCLENGSILGVLNICDATKSRICKYIEKFMMLNKRLPLTFKTYYENYRVEFDDIDQSVVIAIFMKPHTPKFLVDKVKEAFGDGIHIVTSIIEC